LLVDCDCANSSNKLNACADSGLLSGGEIIARAMTETVYDKNVNKQVAELKVWNINRFSHVILSNITSSVP